MTFDSLIAERKLKTTAQFMQQSMWLVFLIAPGLLMIVRRSGLVRTGSMWMLGCTVLAFMLSFALRDAVRKIGHRNTEDKLVKEVKTYLESAPSVPVAPPAPPRAAVSQPVGRMGDAFVPCRAADFLPPQSVAPRAPGAGLAVFDAMPARDSIGVRLDYYAVLLPVRPTC